MSANSRLALILAIVVAIIAAISVFRPDTLLKPVDHELGRVSIHGTTIYVSLADTPEEREQGLSGRSFLAPDEGMLFTFEEEGMHSFWMKDMRISIDILWIASDGSIVKILENATPESYPTTYEPEVPVKYVLEVPAGYSKLRSINVGDRVEI